MSITLIQRVVAEDADWQELWMDGGLIGDEYEVGSQATAVCQVLDHLGIEYEFQVVYREYDDMACEWGPVVRIGDDDDT